MSGVALGWWYAVCCAEDLYPIETDEELAAVVEGLADNFNEGLAPRVWSTLEDALADADIRRDIARGISDKARQRLVPKVKK